MDQYSMTEKFHRIVLGNHQRVMTATIPEIRLSIKQTQKFFEYYFDNTQVDLCICSIVSGDGKID